MIPDPTAALVSFLRSDVELSQLVGVTEEGVVRVFGAELDYDEAHLMPRAAVVVADTGGGSIGEGARSFIEISNSRVDVRCYGATPLQAKAVYLAAHSALKNLSRTVVDRCLIHSAVVEGGPLGLREPEVDWPLVLGIYSVKASEIEVV